jgi:predicted lipoprotein
MKLNFVRLIGLGLLLVGLAGCGVTEPQGEVNAGETPANAADSFDRRAMLSNIVEHSILPLHNQFVAETEALQQAVHQFRADPTTENLAQVQRQWQSTAAAWAQAEHLGFRFTMVIHNQIKKWPINANFIEKFITETTDPIDEPFIETIGSTSKGLTAIEYLIFDPKLADEEIVDRFTAEPRRMAYLVSLVENLQRKSRELQLMWVAGGDNQAQAFIEADFSGNNAQGSISMLANEMIEDIEHIANARLNYPRKGAYGEPQPEAVESPYAQYSALLIANNLQGLQQTFNAGLGGYLDFLQAGQSDARLSEAINRQFEQAIIAVEAISPSLQAAVVDDPAAVERAYNEVKALLVLFKVDMANQMGITITFSDNDGD